MINRNNVDIVSGDCREVKFDENANEALVKKVRIYGGFKTMMLKEIGYEFFRYNRKR